MLSVKNLCVVSTECKDDQKRILAILHAIAKYFWLKKIRVQLVTRNFIAQYSDKSDSIIVEYLNNEKK